MYDNYWLNHTIDHNLLKEVAKAIAESKYHINPQINGDAIRVIFPRLTEESRKESIKKQQFIWTSKNKD